MEHLPFVLWVLVYPLVTKLVNYIDYLSGRTYSETVRTWSALISLFIWITIGYLVY